MSIQENVTQVSQLARALAEHGKLSKQVKAVCIEMNQRYIEYLEELENAPLQVLNGVRVEVDGKVIDFPDSETMAAWLAGQDD